MLLDHAGVAMAQLRRDYRERHAAHREPAGIGVAQPVEVDRRIDPGRRAGRASGRCCSDLPQGFPLARTNRRALPGFPAAS